MNAWAKRCVEQAPLSAREVALVKLAISIGARMEGSAHAHGRKAVAGGIEAAALEHVAILACPTIGFPAMMMALGWVRDVTAKPAGGATALPPRRPKNA